jgi:hypothetical protein
MSRARRSFARALRIDQSSLVQGGLAFLLAYTIAYVVNAI